VIAAFGLKRLAIAAAGLAAIGGGALVALPFFMPADTVREAVKAEIRAVTGLDPVLRGSASVSLFPVGAVSFDDVSLGDNRTGAPALTAEHVVTRLRFFPFLIGRVEIADISLVRPTISIVFAADHSSNWSGHIETLAGNLNPGLGASRSFSEIRIEDGTVILRNESDRIVETLTNVEFALAWPSISSSFAATGRFSLKDKPIDASVSFADFPAVLRGDRSGLKVRLSGELLKLAFDGYLSHRPSLKMDGTLAADTASLRDALQWFGQRAPPGGGFGRFAVKAQTNVVGSTIGLSGVNVDLDGNSGEGALAFGGRQTLQGTLAAEGLDLTPYISTVRLLARGGEHGWDANPIALDGLEGVDIDLRLSAARVKVGKAALGRTAVTVNLRGGGLTVAVGESEAFGGIVKGTIGLAKSPAGADFSAQLQFADVDLEQSLSEAFGIRRLEGKGNIGLILDASGASVYELTKALNGTAGMASRKGAIVGFNVEQLLKRIERRPLSIGSELRTGRTPYETLAVNLKITNGIANIETARMEGAAVSLELTGSASIPARELDLRGTAGLVSNVGNGDPPTTTFELPFMVQGRWDDPDVTLDPLSRIERSGAAAPLLDAVRNGSAREAVRSYIERLTGGPARPASVPPSPEPPALAGASAPTELEPAAPSKPPSQDAPDPSDAH
jgi:AsmA protein